MPVTLPTDDAGDLDVVVDEEPGDVVEGGRQRVVVAAERVGELEVADGEREPGREARHTATKTPNLTAVRIISVGPPSEAADQVDDGLGARG